jgi:hypothetical protein
MNRFKEQPIDLKRIRAALWRRTSDLPHAIAWSMPFGFADANRVNLAGYHNQHKGERCFIMANGPSLTSLDLGRLATEQSFGMNRVYLMFDRLQFTPTYYVAINDLVIRQFVKDIEKLDMPKFLNWNLRNQIVQKKCSHFLRLRIGLGDDFSFDITKPISSGGTVTFVSLELAYYMGFKEVILIGLDHRYQEQGTPNAVQKRTQAQDASHFHPNYFPKGTKWMLPDLKRSELAYELALQAYQKDGRRILDATRDGNCTVFPKVKFNELF